MIFKTNVILLPATNYDVLMLGFVLPSKNNII